MKRLRRRLFLVAGAFASLTGAVIASCGFPEPNIVPDGNEAGGGGDAPGDAPVDVTLFDAAAFDGDANSAFDSATADVEPPIDATGEKKEIDAAGCVCDCDKDNFRLDGGFDADANSAEGMICATMKAADCDDLDERAFPDAGFNAALPVPPTNGDWNCDGKREGRWPTITCASHNPALENCPKIEGFTDNPGCGTEGRYVVCDFPPIGGISCIEQVPEKRIQQCR